MMARADGNPHCARRLAGAWLLLLAIGWLAWAPGLADAPRIADKRETLDGVSPPGEPLPRTDGAEVAEVRGPSPVEPGPLERLAQLRAAHRACDGPCVTPFGTLLGAADGVEARSNCVSTCLRLDYSFVDRDSGEIWVGRKLLAPKQLEYAGVTYQCVEYARRWWIQARGLTFGDVPTAADIFALTEGLRLPTRESIPLGRSVNGSARRAPQRGDLLVYHADPEDPEWRFGHVAVVVAADPDQGWVALAEENYDNRPWQDPEAYARRARLFTVGARHTLVDVAPGETQNPDGGRIAGWVYPVAEP